MVQVILERVIEGQRLSIEEALRLYESQDIHAIGLAAQRVSERFNGPHAYFIVNRHINPTNICVNRCRFCAFSRSKGEEGAFEMSIEEIVEAIGNSNPMPKEVHIVGGLHPDWDLGHYCRMLRTIKENFPEVSIKAFTAVEIDHMSRLSGLSVEAVLEALKEAGLDLMPGGGAEIIPEETRQKLCPEKISGQRYLEIHRTAHRLGIKTNATMLYGHIESLRDRLLHLEAIRALQDETGGFQAFIPLSYQSENTPLKGRFPSGLDDLMTIAISRLFLDNIPHIKAYWVMLGEKLAQVALLYGADDLEGTVVQERIAHSAGARSSQGLSVEELVRMIKKAGRVPVERDSFYNPVVIYDEEPITRRGS
ncbi:MAG: aminofutalosine synthase MqnE [Nitrospirae bacterium]|nr:MAG: aminofutalosine synthase MqnE [Nitrospirota bacterium]